MELVAATGESLWRQSEVQSSNFPKLGPVPETETRRGAARKYWENSHFGTPFRFITSSFAGQRRAFMGESVKTNWSELSQQVADLQVKAFLRLIFEIGEVLEEHSQHPLDDSLPMPGRGRPIDHESTGKNRKLVTCVTDHCRTNGISSRERQRNPFGLQKGLGQNDEGERLNDEQQTVRRMARVAAMAKTERTSGERERRREADCNP
jgi:hypothetical protein